MYYISPSFRSEFSRLLLLLPTKHAHAFTHTHMHPPTPHTHSHSHSHWRTHLHTHTPTNSYSIVILVSFVYMLPPFHSVLFLSVLSLSFSFFLYLIHLLILFFTLFLYIFVQPSPLISIPLAIYNCFSMFLFHLPVLLSPSNQLYLYNSIPFFSISTYLAAPRLSFLFFLLKCICGR